MTVKKRRVDMVKRQTGILFLLAMFLPGISEAASVTTPPKIGDQAPDFSLPATTGGKISLSQFRGKKLVLIEFYGADFSPV
jgi:hypothetical protein